MPCLSILAALLFFYFLLRLFEAPEIKKTKPSLPNHSYRLFYTDQKNTEKENHVIYSKMLTSQQYNICGKPDYIFKHKVKNRYIPVELKSGIIGEKDMPNEGDFMQLLAYFLIIEDLYHTRVKEGRLIYQDAMFIIRNTISIRKKVLKQLKRMRTMLQTGKEYAEPSFVHCKHCICYKTVCTIGSRNMYGEKR